jgi:hypothetical protein
MRMRTAPKVSGRALGNSLTCRPLETCEHRCPHCFGDRIAMASSAIPYRVGCQP